MREFIPLWAKKHIEGEIIVFSEKNGKIEGHLAFNNPKNVVVRDKKGNILKENDDFVVNGQAIELKNLSYFYFKDGWLNFIGVPDSIPNENERYHIKKCLLADPDFMLGIQFLVDYDCDYTEFPEIFSDTVYNLTNTYRKLSAGKKLKVALFGDSISNAANSSWERRISGYEHWLTKATRRAEKFYNAKIETINVSKSGYGTEWGTEAAEELFRGQDVDLAVIAFGMNDGAAGMSVDEFVKNVNIIIEKIKAIKNDTEFLIISTPVPNPESSLYLQQKNYIYGLKKTEREGVVSLDMTAASFFLLQNKRYSEISGNNLNHPNDFFYEIYSDAVTEFFLRLKESNENRLEWNDFLQNYPVFEGERFTDLPKNIKGGYLVNTVGGKRVKTFCFIGLPTEKKEKYPAVILIHGAGGNAFYKWVDAWNKRGYVAVSLDLNCTEFANNDLSERQTNVDAVQLDYFDFDKKKAENTWIYYGVSEIIAANSYLRSLSYIDKENIGLVSISWGGVLSLLALGNDDRFKAAAIIYSAGFISDDTLGKETHIFENYEKKRYFDCFFDCGNYLRFVTAPILFQGGLADGAFDPLVRQRTYRLTKGEKELAVVKDLYHDNESNFGNENVFGYIDDKLRCTNERAKIVFGITGDGFLTIESNKTLERVALLFTAGKYIQHTDLWKEIAYEIKDKQAKIAIPENADYYMAVAYYGDKLYSSSEIFKKLH